MASNSPKMSPDEEAEIQLTLEAMEVSERYNTPSRYSSASTTYPDNLMPFSAVHMAYMKKYPSINPEQYIQNLRLSTRIK